jgi:hypothetical protein
VRYLKTYKSINESDVNMSLEFEDFKDIFIDIVDKYSNRHIFDQDRDLYELVMSFNPSFIDHNFDILGELSDFGEVNDPQIFDYDGIASRIEDASRELDNIKNTIDDCIAFNEKIKSLMNELNEYIIPSLTRFSNCDYIGIAFDSEDISIIYFIK